MKGGGDAHVPTDQIAVPAHADTEALHIAGAAHGNRPAAANGVEHIVANHTAGDADPIAVNRGLRRRDMTAAEQ